MTFGEEEINAFILEEDPKNYVEAMRSIDSNFWLEAINGEIESIMNNNIWVLCDLPRGCKALGSNWIFRKKYKPGGSIEKYKSRLVVGGHRQKKGNLTVHQMDVKTAILNGDLNEEKYMKQPEGCVVLGYEDKGNPGPSISMHYDSQAIMGLANNQLYNGKKR
ncbi:hypothetical protein AgCh_018080 [Apium graveolens]